MEEASTLKLVIEKGPRKGETLEFRSGSVVRIGRVVRGNTLAIKDAGISTKHLSIVSATSGKWTITDLDSSNGTILNGSNLTPLVPSDLGNGDIIKVGEDTSIIVEIEVVHEVGAVRLRRNPRRGDSKANLTSIGGDSELIVLGFGGELGKEGGNPRKRGRPMKGKVINSEPQESLCEVENVIESDSVAPNEQNQGRGVSTRMMTRSSKNKEISNHEAKILAQVFDKKTRGDRSRKKIDDNEEEECKKHEGNLKYKGNSTVYGQEVAVSGQIVGKMTQEDKRRKKSLEGEPLERVENVVLDEKGEECEKVEGSLSNEQSEVVRGEVGEDNGPDLEKMTLGQWFDYLEVYLPKQIHNETEEMILQMNRRAEQVQEFILKQKSAKENDELHVG